MTNTQTPLAVAVLGLGAMGTALAAAFDAAGHKVYAWNRTQRSLADLGLGDTRIELAQDPNHAVTQSDIVVVCLLDHAASRAVIDTVAPAVQDRLVVNASTGTPAETQTSARLAAQLGLRYLTAAIMVPTPLIGTDNCFVLYAGNSSDITELGPLQSALGGIHDVVGDEHAVPAALDLAMLDVYFAGMYAFLHATALVGSYGVDSQRFLPYAEAIVDTLKATLPGLASATDTRTYDGGQARLDMCLAFLEKITATSAEVGIDAGLAEVVRDASSRALAQRSGSTDWDVVAEEMLTQREDFARLGASEWELTRLENTTGAELFG